MSGPVVVSGATGFLGAAICARLRAGDTPVRRLVREPDSAGDDAFACDLPDSIDTAAFVGAETLVHCAWDTRFQSATRARDTNVAGSRALFAAARTAGARIVFISTLSAAAAAESSYARTKLEVEALLDLERDAVVRPGTVIGEGGVFWRQAQSIASLPFIPLFYGGEQRYQTVALADVCEGIAAILEHGLTGAFGLAEVEPVRLRDVYQAVAEALGKRAHFLTLPGPPMLAVLRLCETLGFRLPVSSDNLLGLKHLRAFDLADDVRRLGLSPCTTQESLAEIRWERIARK